MNKGCAPRDFLRIGAAGLMLWAVALSAARAESKTDTKAAGRFAVRWLAIWYNKAVVLHNPAVSSNQPEASEALALSCEIEIRDPNHTLGICPEAISTRVTDRKGREMDVGAPPNRPRRHYDTLRYQLRFMQPPTLPRWQRLIRSLLRTPQNTNLRPQPVNELQPSRVEMQLDMGLLEHAGGEIRRIKGYFYALMAESLEYIEVPFEPNDNWVRLTPELEVLVREASCAGTSYRFRIETRPQGRPPMSLSIDDPLPSRLAVAQEFIGEDGKPSGPFGGRRPLPAHIGGVGSGGGNSQVKAIRFIIAVNPAHHKIPFELQHIPLPDPDQPADRPKPW